MEFTGGGSYCLDLGVWEGCRKMCGLDVLRGLLKVGWDVEKLRAWPIVSVAYCKCICKKKHFFLFIKF